MNQDLSFWRKLMLDLNATPKTDADLAYLYRNLVRPEIPVSALWDAERGARDRANTSYAAKNEMSVKDFRPIAIKNRGWGLEQSAEDMPKRTPTNAIMKQLLNPDYLIVPEKNEMGNIWK